MWPPIRPTRKQEADSRGIAGSSVTPFPAPSAVSVVGPCGSLPVSGLTDRSRLGMIWNRLHILSDKHFSWQSRGAPSFPLRPGSPNPQTARLITGAWKRGPMCHQLGISSSWLRLPTSPRKKGTA